MSKEKKAVDFEQQLASLEDLVESLESGDLSLEDSLKSFEQGIKVCLLYTSPSPRDRSLSRMPSSA